MSRLYKKFKEEISAELKSRHPERCAMELPVLKKIIISMGLGDALKDKNALSAKTLISRHLDILLRALHPFMPFVTEEIWSILPDRKNLLMIEQWPIHQQND